MSTGIVRSLPVLVGVVLLGDLARPADWPQWRRDAARTGNSPEELPGTLHLRWVIELPTPRPAWPSNQDKLQFDRIYEPILADGNLYVGSMLSDKLTAHDAETGEERWSFYTDGPVRLAPAAAAGKVYFSSDDGYLYCLDGRTGGLEWKFRGGPSNDRVLGNDRLVSAWPARGAPVIHDGKVYFGASIWPFMGIFLHALDARTGEVVWTQSGSGSNYLVQQHNSAAFAGVAPQGYMAVTGDRLVVAGGRTMPAVYDRLTGKFLHFDVSSRAMGSKGGGGYEVVAGKDFYLNRGKLYKLDSGAFVTSIEALILTDYAILGKDKESIVAYRAKIDETEEKDRKGKVTKKTTVRKLWTTPIGRKVEQVFLKSGMRLYCSGDAGDIFAVDLPRFDRGAEVSWSASLPDRPLNMISGARKLFVSTEAGRIYCFGGEASDARLPERQDVALITRAAEWKYLDDGSDQGQSWREPSFDDSKWKSGQGALGYGDKGLKTKLSFGKDDKKKPITCYFRHEFDAGDSGPGSFRLGILVDDGAVIYLNGAEVGRKFMPSGDIDFKTEAEEGSDEKTYYELSVASGLRRGRNLLAVEVHQQKPTSSDLRFDLELKAVRASHAPRLEFAADRWTGLARDILSESGVREGYCLALGVGSGRLAEEIASQSDLHVIVIDSDGAEVDSFRRRLDRLGAYGTRVAALVADPLDAGLPPYMADLIVAEEPTAAGLGRGREFVDKVFHSLRPFSGVACFRTSAPAHETLATAARAVDLDRGIVERRGHLTVVRRIDAPTGSADWTHQYADAAQSVVSADQLVRAPLGLLWFGGPSNEAILPRHGHGPTPQVVGGRLFIEGRDIIRAVDIYTGRLLWERTLKDVGKYYDYTGHEPGANAIGSNYVSLADGIYVALENRCLRLDPASGKTISEFSLPQPPSADKPPEWGYINATDGILVGGTELDGFESVEYTRAHVARYKGKDLKPGLEIIKALIGFEPIVKEEWDLGDEKKENDARAYLLANFNKLLASDHVVARIPLKVRYKKDSEPIEKELAKYLAEVPGRKPSDFEAMRIKRKILEKCYGLPKYEKPQAGKGGSWLRKGSKKLAVLDRISGDVLWEHETTYSARHNSIVIGDGKLFFVDAMSRAQVDYHRRRALVVNEKGSVNALDLRTGESIWSDTTRDRLFGTWLGYSEEHDVLLQAGSQGRDRAKDEVGQRMIAYRGATGEVLWEHDEKYSGPCLLHGRTIYTQGYGNPGFAYDLLTGEPRLRRHPVSGLEVKWKYTRNYGCNTAIGGANLLTFRSAAAGYYDLVGDSGTGNLGGFRSGCTSNLIPAGGILNAPDYTRTCSCSYQNQASLGLVHEPDTEMWTFLPYKHSGPVRRVGLNFGAPGDRRGPDGTFWLDYPSVGGASPDLPVQVETPKDRKLEPVRHHQSRVDSPAFLGSGAGSVASAPNWVASSAVRGSGEISLKLLFPGEIAVANEVTGGAALKAKNASLCGEVASSTVPQTAGGNRSSLEKGSGDKLEAEVGDEPGLATASVTVELWVKTDGDFDYIDARGDDAKKRQGFVFDNRKLRVRYYVANETGDGHAKEVKIEARDKLAENKWVHVAFTYDSRTGVGTIFVDGKVVGNHDGPDGRPLWWNTRTPVYKTAKDATSKSHIDELRISRVALDPSQFLNSDEEAPPSDAVVGYWRMEGSGAEGATFTVRLVFAEIEDVAAGERIFDVGLQGKICLDDFDIASAARGVRRPIVREFRGVHVEDFLRITLTGKGDREPLLNGVQLIRERQRF